MQKQAEGESSGGTLQSAAGTASIPQPQIVPRIAPGKRGPEGMGMRNNFTRVNSGSMPAPDAGATSQKSLSPKYGSIMNGAGMATRPTLQDMVKAAQDGAMSRTRVSDEARRQAEQLTGEKTASAQPEEQSVPTEFVDKLAGALEFLANDFAKGAASIAPPPHFTETIQQPGKGPGALEVSQATASTSLPDKKGQGHQQPPQKPGSEKVRPSDAAGNALETNMRHPTGGKEPVKLGAAEILEANRTRLQKLAAGLAAPPVAPPAPVVEPAKTAEKKCEKCGEETCKCKPAEKTAAELLASNLERLKKVAEDAINPAHISAGKAVPPETSAAGEPGGAPAGGKPKPGTDMVGSSAAAIKYTKGQAKAGPKSDLKTWFTEPALTSKTDSTLRAAFDSTPKAGTKFAEAGGVKVAAARALLEQLLEEQTT